MSPRCPYEAWSRLSRGGGATLGGTCQRLCRIAASITLSRLTKTMSDTSSQTEIKPGAAEAERAAVPAASVPDKISVEQPAPDPTRYGDWEKNGRCIDF